MLLRDLSLSRDGKHVVVNVDIEVFLLHTGKFVGDGDSVILVVLVNVHPRYQNEPWYPRAEENNGVTWAS